VLDFLNLFFMQLSDIYILFIANILSFIGLGVNIYIYANQNIIFNLILLVVVSFIALILPIYSFLRYKTKKHHLWLSFIICAFSMCHNSSIIYSFIHTNHQHYIYSVSFSISISKSILFIIIILKSIIFTQNQDDYVLIG